MPIKHTFQSGIPDDPQAVAEGRVTPSEWNREHTLPTPEEIGAVSADSPQFSGIVRTNAPLGTQYHPTTNPVNVPLIAEHSATVTASTSGMTNWYSSIFNTLFAPASASDMSLGGALHLMQVPHDNAVSMETLTAVTGKTVVGGSGWFRHIYGGSFSSLYAGTASPPVHKVVGLSASAHTLPVTGGTGPEYLTGMEINVNRIGAGAEPAIAIGLDIETIEGAAKYAIWTRPADAPVRFDGGLQVTGPVSGIDASDVGLGNVDNTSDANKPVSTATQTALDGKTNLAGTAGGQTIKGGTAAGESLTLSSTANATKGTISAGGLSINEAANTVILNSGATTTGTTDLLVNPATKASGNLIEAKIGASSKFYVAANGSAFSVTGGFNSHRDAGFSSSANAWVRGSSLNGAQMGLATNHHLGGWFVEGTFNNSSTAANPMVIRPTYIQSGTSSSIDLLINRTETTLGSGAHKFISLQSGATGGIERFSVTNTGVVRAAQYNLSALNTAPSSATDTGTLGEIRITATHIYVCIATNTWVRAALATW